MATYAYLEHEENNSDFPEKESSPSNTQQLIEKTLLTQRKVFLWGGVNDKLAHSIVSQLLYLDKEDSKKNIQLFINSPGGSVSAGMVIYDVMRAISAPVSTICMGLAASMGSILLAAGKKGKRYILPHAEVMIHQPSLSGTFHATSADIAIQANQIKKTKLVGARILAEHCGKSIEQILNDFERDFWFDAQSAVAYGIVDNILEKI